MRLLLDTHLFLWLVDDSRKLKPAVRRTIESASEVFVSAASLWEIAIKARLGKLDADPGALAEAIEPSGCAELPVTALHAARVAGLAPHHEDPFDRMLVAQALCEPLILLTADEQLARYGDFVKCV